MLCDVQDLRCPLRVSVKRVSVLGSPGLKPPKMGKSSTVSEVLQKNTVQFNVPSWDLGEIGVAQV